MKIHLALLEMITQEFSDQLVGDVEMKQDALLFALDNGVEMEIRYPDPQHYSFKWLWGEAECEIDTAPLYPDLVSFPRHFHGPNGEVQPDIWTSMDKTPLSNVRDLLRALMEQPLLTGEM